MVDLERPVGFESRAAHRHEVLQRGTVDPVVLVGDPERGPIRRHGAEVAVRPGDDVVRDDVAPPLGPGEPGLVVVHADLEQELHRQRVGDVDDREAVPSDTRASRTSP